MLKRKNKKSNGDLGTDLLSNEMSPQGNKVQPRYKQTKEYVYTQFIFIHNLYTFLMP